MAKVAQTRIAPSSTREGQTGEIGEANYWQLEQLFGPSSAIGSTFTQYPPTVS